MRLGPNTLSPFESAICEAALELRRRGIDQFHGYLVARFIRDETEARRVASQGALYRALDRLTARGLLTREWEPAAQANAEGRPARRLYALTPAGERACKAQRERHDLRPALRAIWRVV